MSEIFASELDEILPGEISFRIIVASIKTNKGNRKGVPGDTAVHDSFSRAPAERCAKVQKYEFERVS